MQLDIVVAFFLLGAVATWCKADFEIPKAIYRGCTQFLLLAIGIKGGIAFTQYPLATILPQSLIVIHSDSAFRFWPILFCERSVAGPGSMQLAQPPTMAQSR